MRRARGERGQILAIVVLALVALLGIAAFAIDVGYAYYAKRQLQSATDAAALAGAQDLPVAATAIAPRRSYAAANTPSNLAGLTYTYQTKCTATSMVATGCNAAVNPNALDGHGHGRDGHLVRQDLRHRPLQRLGARECVQPLLGVARRHRRRDRPDGLDVHADGRGGNCIDLDNAKDGVRTMIGMFNPPPAQIGMVAFPPSRATATSPCVGALQLTRRQRLRRLRQRQPRLRDGHDQRQLQDSPTAAWTRHRASTCTPWTAGQLVHPGRRQHLLQRGAAAGAGRAGRERTAERARLHRLPDRRRGQHRQRLRATTPPTRRATTTTSSPARRPSTSPTPQGGGDDDLQHRLRAREQRQLHRRRLPHERTPERQLGRVHARRLPAATTTRATPTRARPITSYTHAQADRLARQLLQPAEPGPARRHLRPIATDIGQGSSRLVDDNF